MRFNLIEVINVSSINCNRYLQLISSIAIVIAFYTLFFSFNYFKLHCHCYWMGWEFFYKIISISLNLNTWKIGIISRIMCLTVEKLKLNDDQALTCIHGEVSVEMTAIATLDLFFRHVTNVAARSCSKIQWVRWRQQQLRFGADSRMLFIDVMKMWSIDVLCTAIVVTTW